MTAPLQTLASPHPEPEAQVSVRCRACQSQATEVFYRVPNIPTNSVILLCNREDAVGFPRGRMELTLCRRCGFVFNASFEPVLAEYSSRYEETQGFSATFRAWHMQLAEKLVARHDLHHKTILEIGCGKGEFLSLLCELGSNRGIGFDPAWIPGRVPSSPDITFVPDFYTSQSGSFDADFVCCKMTLEHVAHVSDFVRMVAANFSSRPDTVVFFQVPDVDRILAEGAFWDIYYEHCSYFGQDSLRYLFESCGFSVIDIRRDYQDQYLMIEARPAPSTATSTAVPAFDAVAGVRKIRAFALKVGESMRESAERVRRSIERGQRMVLWGAGSKAVAWLTTLGVERGVECVVDVNPHKHGSYLAGTGQLVVGPEYLAKYQPDLVLVMNPAYRDEVRLELRRLGLTPEVVCA